MRRLVLEEGLTCQEVADRFGVTRVTAWKHATNGLGMTLRQYRKAQIEETLNTSRPMADRR